MELIRVEGETNLYRDSTSQAIINTDVNAYENYISNKNKKLQERQEIESIKNDVAELKDLMKQLLQKL